MNDQRSAAIREQTIGSIAQHDVHVCQGLVCGSLSADREIHHIAGVWSLWVLRTVHFVGRIEVWTCGSKIRSFTLCHLVNMDSMLTGRQVLQVQLDLHPA